VKIIICGCGKVGTRMAEILIKEKHDLTIIDRDADSFQRVDSLSEVQFITGSIVDQEVLVKAGIETADIFLALTVDDNANLFSAQIAKEIFNVKKVIARVKDPIRSKSFTEELGLSTICGTELITDQIKKKIGVK
jgi:trk system potassium uptake protein TrkA